MMHFHTNARKIAGCLAYLSIFNVSFAQLVKQDTDRVYVSGAMKNVMWKGELFGTIHLDTIPDKTHLYGLGPVEYLAGEILVMDGRSYVSRVASASSIKMEETYNVKAPFFVWATIEKWIEFNLPDSIQNLAQLERHLDTITLNDKLPFAFKLNGIVEKAKIHIKNLPAGARVSSPEDAHNGEVKYDLVNEPSEIIGFFSRQHQSIFTHHDTYLHLHLISADRSKMGHLEEVWLKKGTVKLYLQAQ